MLTRAEARRLRALSRRKGREASGLFVAEGVRLVQELADSRIVLELALVAPSLEDTARGSALARALRARVRTIEVTDRELRELAGTEAPQGVLAVAALPRWRLADLAATPRAVGVLLDGVQDPGNFGTIVRSADAFGAAFVVALPGTVDPWNAKAVRAAAGSSLRVPIVETSLDEVLEYLAARRFRIFGADAAGTSIDVLQPPARAALVLGNEGAGLGAAVRAACDEMVAVPIRGAAESLNVGVAAGILLYRLTRE